MKQRVTFITYPTSELPEGVLTFKKGDSLHVKDLKALREDRFTFSFQELPQSIKDVVRQTQELYIRYDSGRDPNLSYKGPFNSRLPIGLHIFATPLRTSKMTNLCSYISRYTSAKCDAVETSFTDNKRTKQYYSPNADILASLLGTVSNAACSSGDCKNRFYSFRTATSVDAKYDAISQTLEVNVLWGKSREWTDSISAGAEVGIFSDSEQNDDPEEIGLEGSLATAGEDDELKPTRFSAPARHHSRQRDVFTAQFVDPPGLHPKLELLISALPQPAEECTLNAYLTVPQPFFVDPYQLDDAKLMESYGVSRVRIVSGEVDLEAPVWAVKKWGAIVLAELDATTLKKDAATSFTLPLHLRYLETDLVVSSRNATMPWPSVFWACKSEYYNKMATFPFERRMLGYDEYFPAQTYYHHFTAFAGKGERFRSDVEVPLLSSRDGGLIDLGTKVVIVVGFLWVLWRIVGALLGIRVVRGKEERKKKE